MRIEKACYKKPHLIRHTASMLQIWEGDQLYTRCWFKDSVTLYFMCVKRGQWQTWRSVGSMQPKRLTVHVAVEKEEQKPQVLQIWPVELCLLCNLLLNPLFVYHVSATSHSPSLGSILCSATKLSDLCLNFEILNIKISCTLCLRKINV